MHAWLYVHISTHVYMRNCLKDYSTSGRRPLLLFCGLVLGRPGNEQSRHYHDPSSSNQPANQQGLHLVVDFD